MGFAIDWKGGDLFDKAMRGTKLAIDQTTGAAVIHSKTHHPWQNRTGTLEGSLQMRPAQLLATGVTGLWGSFTVNYAIYLEADFPYLRPAADAEYPNLASRIRSAIK